MAVAPLAGRVGLWAFGQGTAEFRDVRLLRRVRPLSLESIRPLFAEGLTQTGQGDLRVVRPRTDVRVKVDGSPLARAPSSWATFRATPEGARLLAEAVAFEDEVDAVIDAALAHEIEVTSVANRFSFDEPPVRVLRLVGHGPLTLMAAGVQAAFRASEDVRRRSAVPERSFVFDPRPGAAPDATPIDASAVQVAVGLPVESVDAVFEVSISRSATLDGLPLDAAMGLETRATFSGSLLQARLSGRFALTAAELQPVLGALRRARLHVVALGDRVAAEPAYAFAQFWGRGSALDLAKRFRSVLDAQRASGNGAR